MAVSESGSESDSGPDSDPDSGPDSGPDSDPKEHVSITIRLKRNGPYVIAAEQAAEVVILDADGTSLVPEPGRSIALCRCGGSSTKPFCDRSHRENGFDGATQWTGCFAAEPPVDQASTKAGPTDPQ